MGDPQFVGLRGQSYQIHGLDGMVYNIITEQQCQVNARFVFLSSGQCPLVEGVAGNDCWSHQALILARCLCNRSWRDSFIVWSSLPDPAELALLRFYSTTGR